MRSPDRRRAFTLIEVMAAVFILGLVVVTLARLVSQAHLDEGRSRLRARAALLADRLLAEVEEGIARGAAPELGKRDVSEDDLRATIAVTALDPALLTPGAEEDTNPRARAAVDSTAGPASWLSSPQAEATPPLLQVAVRVTWEGARVDADTGEPYAIARTTYALNPAALKALGELEAGDDGDEDDE